VKTLLSLLAAVALLVWGTHIVRTGLLRIFGANLRRVLASSVRSSVAALFAGMGVTTLLQSSTATALIASSFVGQGLIATAPALAIVLGADVGTSVMAQIFSLDLSWLSPLFILVGVILFLSRRNTNAGRLGRVSIGFGLIILALQLILQTTQPLTATTGVKTLFATLSGDPLLDMLLAAILTIVCYSSLAVVLLTATLAASHVIPPEVALALVLGANLGSGLLAVITTMNAPPETRRIPLGNLLFKLTGCLALTPFLGALTGIIGAIDPDPQRLTVNFHMAFNVALAAVFIFAIGPVARLTERLLPPRPKQDDASRLRHLDSVALDTPPLAISCAAREALRIADTVETMLVGVMDVIRRKDRDGDLKGAQALIAQKVEFRERELSFAESHLQRLAWNTPESIETSSLHLDLISEMKRINSHLCSVAYPILEGAGVLSRSRLKVDTSDAPANGSRNEAPTTASTFASVTPPKVQP